jgi:hypothetical protein
MINRTRPKQSRSRANSNPAGARLAGDGKAIVGQLNKALGNGQ